jgi:hypothetical protein
MLLRSHLGAHRREIAGAGRAQGRPQPWQEGLAVTQGLQRLPMVEGPRGFTVIAHTRIYGVE